MATYAKFMKEILTKKRKYQEKEIIQLSANCSSIIQTNNPHKLIDPDSVTIISIGIISTFYDEWSWRTYQDASAAWCCTRCVDVEVSLIFGRTFMRTIRMGIDMDDEILKVRDHDDEI
ncbi:hypothetical protein Lal_00031854 [Lupinus albus]|nr:hypothetical protein Lal_00031854 [Lupinus albus]